MAIFKLQDGTKFYQWDVKRKLIVTDERIDQVHFTNTTLENAIVQDVHEEEGIRLVDVPAYLLECDCNIIAYAYIQQEGKEYTLVHEILGVTPRKQPDDYIPKDEAYKWLALQEEVLAAAERASASEQEAKTAAENAGTSEQNAKTSADNAEESKIGAENAASAALGSAEAADNAASAAAGSAETAAECEQDAIEAAGTASAKADEAAASAAAAKASENNAKESETNAGASETAAKESETNSKASETNAAASETNAQASAVAADASAKAAADSEAAIKEYDILAGNFAAAADASAKAAAASAAEAKSSEAGVGESAATATVKAAEAADSATAAQEAKTAAEAAAEAAEAARNEVVDFVGGDFATNTALNAHTGDTTAHITADERTAWNSKAEGEHNHEGVYASAGHDHDEKYAPKEHSHSQYLTQHQDISGKANVSDLNAHTGNGTVHITAAERTAWNSKAEGEHSHDGVYAPANHDHDEVYSKTDHNHDEQYAPKEHDHSEKANASDLNAHTDNTTVHITAAERTAWNNKSNFSGNYNDLTNKPTTATSSAAGFMSATDKANLDRLVSSAVSVLSGAVEPAASVGNDGDIYLVTGE